MKVAIFHDETEVHLNPKIGFAWMRQGDQKLLATPGQNQKAVLSGGVNWRSGKLLMVRGAQKVTEVFVSHRGVCEVPGACSSRKRLRIR